MSAAAPLPLPPSPRRRRLLTLGHSYVVALNRRLADEMARVGRGRWEVTVVAPRFFHGDLRPIPREPEGPDSAPVVDVPVYLSRSPHLFFYAGRVHSLLREGWDLVHCWEEPFVLAGGQLILGTPRRTPVVFATFQNLHKRYPPPFQQLEQLTLARADGCIAYGRTVQKVLTERQAYRGAPVRHIPAGVDVEAFRPLPEARARVLERLGWEPGVPVVGYLGRFVPEKGLQLLMTALEGLRTPWRLLLVGGGAQEQQLRAWGERFGDGRVRVVTGVPHAQVPHYLNAMDVLCAPSQSSSRWVEQFGRMLVEAFACGVPVIGSDSGEIPHTIGDAGLIASERSAADWTRLLEELLESPERRRELSRRGLERAHQHFAWPVVARAHLDFFESILAARERRA
jgi:glycosyltransferase involved in cell wall biosynthesis